MPYKAKYPIDPDETLRGYEVRKIMDGINRETERQQFWQIVPFALLLAFVCLAILILGGQ